jgi:hypothetical protein
MTFKPKPGDDKLIKAIPFQKFHPLLNHTSDKYMLRYFFSKIKYELNSKLIQLIRILSEFSTKYDMNFVWILYNQFLIFSQQSQDHLQFRRNKI